jgi:hypothetical protein
VGNKVGAVVRYVVGMLSAVKPLDGVLEVLFGNIDKY